MCMYICICTRVCIEYIEEKEKKRKEEKEKKKKKRYEQQGTFLSLNYYQSKIYRCDTFRLRYASYSYISYILLTLSYYYYYFFNLSFFFF